MIYKDFVFLIKILVILIMSIPYAPQASEKVSCYSAYRLFTKALTSSPEEREEITDSVFTALKDLGFNHKGSFLPIHDSEPDDFCSQPLRSLSNTEIIILQAGQYLAKHEPAEDQRDQSKVNQISDKAFAIWDKNRAKLGPNEINLIKGLEIGRPGRGQFSEDIQPFAITEQESQSIHDIVTYLSAQEHKSVKILINAPGYTLAKLIEEYPDLLIEKVKTIYMSSFGSINSTDGMSSILKLIQLAQSENADIQVIIRDGTIFKVAEDLNFLYMLALKNLSNQGSPTADFQQEMIRNWKEIDASTRKERATVGKDVSEATKAREKRLQTIKDHVKEVSGEDVSVADQIVLSDLFMWILAYTSDEKLITEDFEKIEIRREFKSGSRERIVDLHPSTLDGQKIYRRITDIKFDKSTITIGDITIPVDKNSYLALAMLFTLLKAS